MDLSSQALDKSLKSRTTRVATVAAAYADDVDRAGRFPREAVEAMKSERLLSVLIPVELGGEGCSESEIAEICTLIAQSCAASAMVFAMHQIKASSLVEHGIGAEWHRAFMRRVAEEQLLLGSATTEGGIGGNLRNSICAIEVKDGVCRLEKDATVISYGRESDAILITSRSHKDAASSDQVMTVFLKDQYTLEQTQTWDTLGMRGTCSDGFLFRGEAPTEQILPQPFAEIAAQSMLATAHLFWGSLWYGIAVDAFVRAQNFVRAAARKAPGTQPPGLVQLAEMSSQLQVIRANIATGLRSYENAKRDHDRLSSMGFAVTMNNVKIATSEMILDVIHQALRICGIMGYKNGTPYSLGRHLRDAHSAELMISNDRILGNTANMLLVHKQETSLLG
ncbi:acyl-CoA/acyl-ACP dehydrogenase [Pseudomonas sp. R2.Fl]|nr:acyl-CoA/acyl-ACP dehydrogenase [Pseudomonas sp. R2.Fl]